jgi:hypothetical protein
MEPSGAQGVPNLAIVASMTGVYAPDDGITSDNIRSRNRPFASDKAPFPEAIRRQ